MRGSGGAVLRTGAGDRGQPSPAGADPSANQPAIRAAAEAFAAAQRLGDASALAAQFTPDAEIVDEDGMRRLRVATRSRQLCPPRSVWPIPGARIEVAIERDPVPRSGRGPRGRPQPRHDGRRRKHTGVATVHRAARQARGEVAPGQHRARSPGRPVRPHDRLKELEWLVGDWIDESADALVRTQCRWSEDGNFLLRSLTMKVRGRGGPDRHATGRLGAPLGRQFKSWEFDSEGGYGEGLSAHDGTRWVVKHTGVTPEGTRASATHMIVPESPDRLHWTALDRVVGGKAVPGGNSFVVVRVPASAGTHARKPAAPASTKDQK